MYPQRATAGMPSHPALKPRIRPLIRIQQLGSTTLRAPTFLPSPPAPLPRRGRGESSAGEGVRKIGGRQCMRCLAPLGMTRGIRSATPVIPSRRRGISDASRSLGMTKDALGMTGSAQSLSFRAASFVIPRRRRGISTNSKRFSNTLSAGAAWAFPLSHGVGEGAGGEGEKKTGAPLMKVLRHLKSQSVLPARRFRYNSPLWRKERMRPTSRRASS